MGVQIGAGGETIEEENVPVGSRRREEIQEKKEGERGDV